MNLRVSLLVALLALAIVPASPAATAEDYVRVLVFDGSITGAGGFPPAATCGDPDSAQFQLAPLTNSCDRYFSGPGEGQTATLNVWVVYRTGFTGKITVAIEGASSQSCTVLAGGTTYPLLQCGSQASGTISGTAHVTGSATAPSAGQWTIDGMVS